MRLTDAAATTHIRRRVVVRAGLAVGAVLALLLLALPGGTGHAQTDPELELALKYNPLLRLTNQPRECSTDGNVYNPATVDIILDQPDVELRVMPSRTVIMNGATAEDIAGLPSEYYLDWPGRPRRPGCTYDRNYRALVEGNKPTVYAHVATEDGVPGLAVQYWYNYYYNDFANKHEGDWEMVQVMFDDADTAAEALQQDPTRTAYSGHAGGELSDWNDPKLQKIGDRPIVFVTTGAHAAHYSEGTFIGVARRGQVFGCDPTTGPHRTVDPELILLPDTAPTEGEFAWLSFRGLWGQEDGSLFSGIEGPATRHRWDFPFEWANQQRDFSDKLPDSILGINPVGAICIFVNSGSAIMLFAGEYPIPFFGGALIMIGALGSVFVFGAPGWLTGRSSDTAADRRAVALAVEGKGFLRRERHLAQLGRASLKIYRMSWPLWLLIGSVMIPVSLGIMLIEQIVGMDWLKDLFDTSLAEPFTELMGLTAGAIVAASLVSYAVFGTLREMDEGKQPSVPAVYRQVASHLWRLIGESAIYAATIGFLSVVLVGIPVAIYIGVLWVMAGHVIMIEDNSIFGSLTRSRQLVRGRWLRVAGTIFLIGAFVALPGPLIVFGFMVFTEPPLLQVIYPLVTALYVLVLFPLSFIASGLLYGDLAATRPLGPVDSPAKSE